MKKHVIFFIVGLLFLNTFTVCTLSKNENSTQPLVSTNSTFGLVIVAPAIFSSALQPLIDHKNTNGVTTILQILDDIYSTYVGRDHAEQIKYFIKDAVETWNITHVLLFGDIEHIPMRTSHVEFTYGDQFIFDSLITDYYYADIYNNNGSFACWDTNHNDKFSEVIANISINGEFFTYIDQLDLYPDVSIGRIPCKTIHQTTDMVNKIISYENTAYDQDWFHRLILMGGDTFPYSTWPYPGCELYEGEVVTDYIAEHMSDFEPIRLWTSLNTFRPLKINIELSKGAGFVSYSGHGFEFGIGTNMPNIDRNKMYYTPFQFGILNNNKLPVVFLEACRTGSLDWNPLGLKIPCFAWALLKKPKGGAIAVIAAARSAMGGDAGDPTGNGCGRLNAQFFLAYKPGISVGEMLRIAKQDYMLNVFPELPDCINVQLFNLLGDPSLKVGGFPIDFGN